MNIPSQNLSGTLRYLGSIDGKPGQWAGVELDEEGTGKNDGTVSGKSYFVCKPKTGIFVAPSKLERCLSSPTPTLPPNATPQRVANSSFSNTTGTGRPRMATSAKHPVTPSSNRRRAASRIAPMTPSPSAGQSPTPELSTTSNNGMHRSMRPTQSKTARSITRPRPTSNAGSVTSNRTNTPSPSLRMNLNGRPTAAAAPAASASSSASDLLSHQQRRSISHSLAPVTTRVSEKPSRIAASSNDTAPKRKPSGVTGNDTLERLRTRIDLLEAENRVLRLKGEQDKAHLEASHMLARDLAVTKNHNGVSASSSESRNSASVASSKMADTNTLAQLEDAHKQIELERQQNQKKVVELVKQISQLKLSSPNAEGQQQQLHHKITELESELEDAAKQHNHDMLAAQETQAKLEHDLANRSTELQSLQNELVRKDEELSAGQGQLDRVSLELSRTTQLHKELLDDYEQATEATQSTSSQTSQIEKLHRSLSESEEQRLLLDKNLDSLRDQLLAAQSESARAESKLVEVEEQHTIINQYQASLCQIATLVDNGSDGENTPLLLKLDSAEDVAEASQQLQQSIKQSVDNHNKLLRANDERIDSLEEELSHARDDVSDDTKLRSQIEELQRKNKELTEERDRLLQDQIAIRDYIDQLEMEVKRLVDDIEQLNLENNTLAEELKLASMHNSTTSLDINALDSKLAGETSLPAKDGDAAGDEDSREVAALRENHVREISALNAKVADIQRQKDRDVKELQDELSYLENMVEDRTFDQFDEHDTTISSLKEENEQLRRQLKQQQTNVEPVKPSSTTSAEASSKDNKPVVCCEICDSTDHSITECPEIKATSSTIFKQESSIDSSRPYCDNCESFSSHWTEECPHGDEMF